MLSEAFISFTHFRYLKYVLFAIPSSVHSVVCSAFSCNCTMSPAVTSGPAAHPCPAITPPPSFFSRATLPDLPHPPAHLFTTIYNGSFPLVASARLCSLLFFFCPSFHAFCRACLETTGCTLYILFHYAPAEEMV